MGLYYIVKKGDLPGNNGSAILDTLCAQWSESQDKISTEVIETDLGGNVVRRLPRAESEKLARAYRKLAG